MSEYNCKKCDKGIDWNTYLWKDHRCNSCNNEYNQNTWGFVFLSIFLIFLLGIPIGYMNYNYQLEKCDNLNSSQSNYDFTNTVEINANYNEYCYYLVNHPLAPVKYFLGYQIIFSILIGQITFVIRMVTK